MFTSFFKYLFVILFFIPTLNYGQIKGQIVDTNDTPLPFVNILVENSTIGTTSNENGYFDLNLIENGDFTIVFQFLGYKTQQRKISYLKNNAPYTLYIKLQEELVSLDEIIVSAESNAANEIIKKAIQNKSRHLNKTREYKADFYSRGLYKVKNAPEKILGQEVGDLGGALDSTRSGIVYLSETMSKISAKTTKEFKEEIIASKVSGDDSGFSFNTASSVNFSFYNNTIPIIEQVVSPLADFAFDYYRFKLEGVIYRNNSVVNKLQVIPKRTNDRSFDGHIYIVDDTWELYGVDLNITGEDIFFPALEHLNLKQNFKFDSKSDAWILISQIFDFKFKFFSIEGDGKFSAVYSNYNFQPDFDKNYFTNEVLVFNQSANDKSNSYWNSKRPITLTKEEIDDYNLKDSLQIVRKSKTYLDSIDSKNNKFKLENLIYGYSYQNSYKNLTYYVSSPAQAIQFNSVQGWHTNVALSVTKEKPKQNTWTRGTVKFDYGFSDKALRVSTGISIKLNNFSKPILSLTGGRIIEQFNNSPNISPLINTFSSLLFEDNYAKFFDKRFISFNYKEEVFNGVRLNGSISFEHRSPVFNNSNYVIFNDDTKHYTSNNPLNLSDYENGAIVEHNVLKTKLNSRIRFNQKYYTYPDGKFNEYSRKTPELNISYTGVLAGSSGGYKYHNLDLNLFQNINLNNKGRLVYNLSGGVFLNSDKIAFVDYKHFNGNQTHVNSDELYVRRFNLMPYYDYSTNKSYFEGHVEYNFQGFILNRLPVLKRINYFLVFGGHLAYTKEKSPYLEYSIGLDNIGFGKYRFFRIDYVQSGYERGIMFGLKFLRLLDLN